MLDFFGFEIVRAILNFLGAVIRWIYGSIWRTLFNKPKFTFDEYVNGPKYSTDTFDTIGHRFNNRIIGAIFLVILISLLGRFL